MSTSSDILLLDGEGNGQDHTVPSDLLYLYVILELEGRVIPGDVRSVTEQIVEGPAQVSERVQLASGERIGSSPYLQRAEWMARPPKTPNSTNITPTGNTSHYEGPHIGWPWDHSACAPMLRGIQAYHMDGHGWNDLAYSSVECNHGYIFEGRWLGHRTAANGTDHSNQTQYAHCVMIGEGDDFTVAGQQALHDVFEFFRTNGSGDGRNVHGDWFSTACSGTLVNAFVRAGLPVGAPLPAPVPPPSPAGHPFQEIDLTQFNKNAITFFLPAAAVGLTNLSAGAGWKIGLDGGVFQTTDDTPFWGSYMSIPAEFRNNPDRVFFCASPRRNHEMGFELHGTDGTYYTLGPGLNGFSQTAPV